MYKEKKKERSSFLETVYWDYRKFMLSIAGRYLGNTAACEDVFHNAFISLIRNEERLQQLPPAKQKVYILLATRHASIDYLRKERKTSILDLPDDVLLDLLAKSRETQLSSEAPFMSVELNSLLRELSTEDQTLLIGHYVVGLDTTELANLIGCSPGALRVKLCRVKKRTFETFTAAGLRLEDFILG